MPSQGSATQADGPPRGDARRHPSMAGGREIERERGGRRGSVVWRQRKEREISGSDVERLGWWWRSVALTC